MSVIKPFCGLRPLPEKAALVAAPPYDVLSSDEARELVRDNPISFLRVNKSEVDFPPEASIYSDEVYAKGKENLDTLIADGIMVRDKTPSLYLYRLTMNNQSQTGLVTLTSVDEYDNGLIKKHEHTRPTKVNDRAHHIETLNAQVGPVFSTFRNTDKIKSLFHKLTDRTPDVDFVAIDKVRHELWVIDGSSDIDALVAAFGELPVMYIADGHHRSEAGSEVCRRMREKYPNYTGDEPFNFFLNVLFPGDELHIMSYNRVVADLNGRSVEALLADATDSFNIERSPVAVDPRKNHEIGVYSELGWYKLTCKEGTFDTEDPVASIDADVLTKNFLTPLLGIENLRTDDRIDFVGGIRGIAELEKLVNSKKYALAFSLYPVSVDQLLAVADAGEVMPPKSTWFEPKLRSGMVVSLLTD